MRKKYIVIDHENSKYYKDIPYITKKEFNKEKSNVVVGKTRLKEYKSSSNNDELDLLCFNEKEYVVKDRLFGFKKGYVYVGDNDYILLKKRIPFLILLLLLLLLGLFVGLNFRKDTPEIKPEKNSNQETIIPDVKEETAEPETPKENKPSKYVPKRDKAEEAQGIKYIIKFDSNDGEGTMESITCAGNEVCNLPKNTFTKEGYNFTGWSTEINGEPIYLDEMEVFNLSTENNDEVILYAMWHIESFGVEFVNYDGSLIHEAEYDYGDNIINPEDPTREGYTFIGWDTEVTEVKEDLKITALYNINNYEFSYDLAGGAFNEDAPSTYTIEDVTFKIPNPIKKGYTFIGWTTTEEKSPIVDYEIVQGTIGNIELIANYEANSYKLIYDTNGAKELIEAKEINYDEKIGKLPIITKKGYNFINWTNESKEEVTATTIFNQTMDMTIYANWNAVDYSISYNLIGGKITNNPNAYNIEENLKIPNPEKEGYIFLGWTTNDNKTPKLDYEIPKGSVGDIELTANYKPISYYISYNSSGGEGTMEDIKIKYNNSIRLSKNTFTKEGYNFLGWSTEENGEVVYQDEQEIYNLSNEDGSKITLYAKWEIIKLSVKYYDLFGVVLKEEIVSYGNTANYPEDPFIDGYTFVGWSPSSDVIKTDTIFQAKYTKNDYVIKYNLNTGSSDDTKEIKYNVETDAITLPQPTREGYTFLGWTGSNGLKPEIKVVIPKGTVGNKNYKANWVSNIYKVSLNPNKGTITPDYINISYNSLYGIIPTPTRRGYSFEGWYYNNSLIEGATIMNSSFDHELIADWKVITYNISYNLAGGSITGQPTTYNIETETFTLPNPTREGYTFLGWTGSNGTTPSTNVKVEKGSIGDKSYTANWKAITYNISYNLAGGSITGQPTTYNIETNTFTLPTPTREGYTFLGWTGSNGTTPSTSVKIEKGSMRNKSYTANWKVITYNISYNLAGGSITGQPTTYNIETNTFTLPQPTRTGYTFAGWSGTGLNTATKSVSISKGTIGNRSYTATWNVNYYNVNYYVNGSLWATRSTAYNSSLENLNAQSALDIYHKFNYWDGWVDKMPTNTVNLYANITESYCMLMTGHGPYGNASALLSVFQSAGWTGRIEEAPSAPGQYWVVTDYTLTRAQADIQRNYIASHTNYKNYNFPYLYWVAVSCTNGIGDTWTRGLGQSNFVSQY